METYLIPGARNTTLTLSYDYQSKYKISVKEKKNKIIFCQLKLSSTLSANKALKIPNCKIPKSLSKLPLPQSS